MKPKKYAGSGGKLRVSASLVRACLRRTGLHSDLGEVATELCNTTQALDLWISSKVRFCRVSEGANDTAVLQDLHNRHKPTPVAG